MFFKIDGKLIVYHSVYKGPYIGVAELLLSLPLELRLGKLYGDNSGNTLAHILAAHLVVTLDDVYFCSV